VKIDVSNWKGHVGTGYEGEKYVVTMVGATAGDRVLDLVMTRVQARKLAVALVELVTTLRARSKKVAKCVNCGYWLFMVGGAFEEEPVLQCAGCGRKIPFSPPDEFWDGFSDEVIDE